MTNTEDSTAPVDIEVDEKVENLRELEVEYVDVNEVSANEYNPNRQNENEFRLLLKSIREDGFTQPIVVLPENDDGERVIIDGEHRWRAAAKLGMGKIPVVEVDMDESRARIATLRHNRASGSENIDLAADVLRDLQELDALDLAQDSLMLDDLEMNRLLDDIPVTDELAAEEFSTAWEPDDQAKRKDDLEDGGGSRDLDAEDGESSATDEAMEDMRERERRLQEAKSEEEKEMARKDTATYKLELIFPVAHRKVLKEVLGERPAETVLELVLERAEEEGMDVEPAEGVEAEAGD